MYRAAIILPFLLLILCCPVKSQHKEDSIIISGCIIADNTQEGINSAYVKISSVKQNRILLYFNTGKENCFRASIPFTTADTILVSISHMAYESITYSHSIAKPGYVGNMDIQLSKQKNVLGEVIVQAPPVWVRGDTTFFKAEFFRTGEETKLKDLIVKMPGFEIDEQGNLLYHKRKVEKIMIEGEEIFADKIRLLLNSFPVHVLNTVQALQNQSGNSALKGLSDGNKVFVNLGLKKEKLKAAFGDGELGAGTEGRYLISPTLFSIAGKLKAGFVGNENNTGSGFDWGETNELKTISEEKANGWLMGSNYLQTVNNFGSRRYIKNQRWDNHLQINTPLSKTLKNKTEISVLKDRQQQTSFFQSSFYSNNNYFSRTDTIMMRHRPSLIEVSNELSWKPDSARELKINFHFNHDGGNSKLEGFYHETSKYYSTLNRIRNSNNSFLITAEWTRRYTSSMAIHSWAEWHRINARQTATGVSGDWKSIFILPADDYTLLTQLHNPGFSGAKAFIEVLKKIKNRLYTAGIKGGWQNVSADSKVFVTDNAASNQFFIDSLGNRAAYRTLTMSAYIKTTTSLLRSPLSISAEGGIAQTQRDEGPKSQKYFVPVFSIDISQRRLIKKTSTLNYNAKFSQRPVPADRLHAVYFPGGLARFERNGFTNKPLRSFSTSIIFSQRFKKYFSSVNSISYEHYFTSISTSSFFNQLLQTLTDSIVNRSTNYFQASSNIFYYAPGRTFNVQVPLNYIRTTRLVNIGQTPAAATFNSYAVGVILTKEWQKKYFTQLQAHYTLRENKLPLQLKDQLLQKTADVQVLAKQRVQFKKGLSILLNAEWYRYNLFAPDNKALLFTDLECRYQVPKKPLILSVTFSNITNQSFFYSLHQTPISQSFFAIPLIRRNVFISARLEL